MKIIIFSNQNLILSVQIIENNEKIFEENIHFEKTSKLTLIKSLFEFTRKNNIIKYIWGNGSIYNLFSFVEKFNQDIFTGIENLSFFNNIEKTLLNHLYNFLNASKEIIEIPLPDIKIKNYDKNFIIPETKEPIIKQDLELKKEDINIDSNISQISNKILSLNKK